MSFFFFDKESFAGVVRHAHMNGIEVAVKSPKIKFSLNPRGLKMFEKEIALQAKVIGTNTVSLIIPSAAR